MDPLINANLMTTKNQEKEKSEYTNRKFSVGERVWCLKSTLNGHLDAVRDICFLTKDILVSVSEDCQIKIWNINHNVNNDKGQQPIQTLQEHTGPIFCCEAAKYQTGIFFTGGNEGIIRIWNLQNPYGITGGSESEFIKVGKEFSFRGNVETIWEQASHDTKVTFFVLIENRIYC